MVDSLNIVAKILYGVMIWDPNKAIDIGEPLIIGGCVELKRFYSMRIGMSKRDQNFIVR